MAKRRGTFLVEESEPRTTSGGNDWDACVSAFLESMTLRNLSWYTKRHHDENLRSMYRLLNDTGYPTSPHQITTESLKKVIIQMIEVKKLNPVTINHHIRTSKQFFAFLVAEGYIEANPAITLNKVKAPKTIIEAFTEEQLHNLLRQPSKKTFIGFRDYCIMLVLLDTGLRLSELLMTRVDDVDLKERKIKVLGKGAKERYVYFNITTKDILQRYIDIRGDNLPHSYLWISREDQPIKRKTLQDRLTLYGEQAGLKNVRVSPHTFRHTFAKLFILNGGNTLALQKLLGHSSLEMVKAYVNLWGTDLQAMHRQFSPVERLGL